MARKENVCSGLCCCVFVFCVCLQFCGVSSLAISGRGTWKDANMLCKVRSKGLLSEERAVSMATKINYVKIGQFFWINARDLRHSRSTRDQDGFSHINFIYIRFGVDVSASQHKYFCKRGGSRLSASPRKDTWPGANKTCSQKFTDSTLFKITSVNDATSPLSMWKTGDSYWLDKPSPTKLLPEISDDQQNNFRCVGMMKQSNSTLTTVLDDCDTVHPFICDTGSDVTYYPYVRKLRQDTPCYSSTNTDSGITEETTLTMNTKDMWGTGDPLEVESGPGEDEDGDEDHTGLIAGVVSAMVVSGVIAVVLYVIRKKRAHVKYMMRRSRYNERNALQRKGTSRSDITYILDHCDQGKEPFKNTPIGDTGISQLPVGVHEEYEDCDRGDGKLKAHLNELKSRSKKKDPPAPPSLRLTGYDGWGAGLNRSTNQDQKPTCYESYDPDSVHLEMGTPVSPQPKKAGIFRKESGRKIQKPILPDKTKLYRPEAYENYKDDKVTSRTNDDSMAGYEVPRQTRNDAEHVENDDHGNDPHLHDLAAYENNTYVKTNVSGGATTPAQQTVGPTVDDLDAYESFNDVKAPEQDTSFFSPGGVRPDQYENYGSPSTGKKLKRNPRLTDLENYENHALDHE